MNLKYSVKNPLFYTERIVNIEDPYISVKHKVPVTSESCHLFQNSILDKGSDKGIGGGWADL